MRSSQLIDEPPRCSTSSVINALACSCCLRAPKSKNKRGSAIYPQDYVKHENTKLMEFLDREQ